MSTMSFTLYSIYYITFEMHAQKESSTYCTPNRKFPAKVIEYVAYNPFKYIPLMQSSRRPNLDHHVIIHESNSQTCCAKQQNTPFNCSKCGQLLNNADLLEEASKRRRQFVSKGTMTSATDLRHAAKCSNGKSIGCKQQRRMEKWSWENYFN